MHYTIVDIHSVAKVYAGVLQGSKSRGGQVVMWHVVACRRRPAAPSDLPKSGGAAAPPAPPHATPPDQNTKVRIL